MLPPLINPTQDESLLQIVPCPPVSTSARLGWTGIQVQHHEQGTNVPEIAKM